MPYQNRKERRKYAREWKRQERKKLRIRAIEMLGGKCAKCGEDDPIVLEIDHIEPILRRPNNDSKYSGINLIRKIVNGTLSLKKFQLLCANCHARKTFRERKKYRNYVQ